MSLGVIKHAHLAVILSTLPGVDERIGSIETFDVLGIWKKVTKWCIEMKYLLKERIKSGKILLYQFRVKRWLWE